MTGGSRVSREALAVATGIGACLASMCLLDGCAKPVATYPGPQRSADEVAILRADGLSSVIRVDGRKKRGKAFELLPGEHDLHVKFEAKLSELEPYEELSRQTLRAYCDVHFFAKAGHLYRYGMSFDREVGWGRIPSKPVKYFDYHMYLVDLTDQRLLEDAVDVRNCHLPRDTNN